MAAPARARLGAHPLPLLLAARRAPQGCPAAAARRRASLPLLLAASHPSSLASVRGLPPAPLRVHAPPPPQSEKGEMESGEEWDSVSTRLSGSRALGVAKWGRGWAVSCCLELGRGCLRPWDRVGYVDRVGEHVAGCDGLKLGRKD